MAFCQQYVTGPALIHIGMPGGGSTRYFGTGKNGVDQDIRHALVPAMNDLAGPVLPLDEMESGMDAMISATMTRWDETIHEIMARFSSPASPRGSETSDARGSLMLYENKTFPLYIVYPRATLPAYAQMPKGYRWLACKLVSPYRLPAGCKPYETVFTWHAMSVYQKGGGFLTYDHDVSKVGPTS